MTVVVFTEDGAIREVLRLGSYPSDRLFYYRLAEPFFHTVLLDADLAVIHETTNGPFDRRETEFACWAPEEEDHEAVHRYQTALYRGADVWSLEQGRRNGRPRT